MKPSFMEFAKIVRTHQGTIFDFRIIFKMMKEVCPEANCSVELRNEWLHFEWRFKCAEQYIHVSKIISLKQFYSLGVGLVIADFESARKHIEEIKNRAKWKKLREKKAVSEPEK